MTDVQVPVAPPVQLSFYGPQWIGPMGAAPPFTVLGAAGSGIVAAAALPWTRPGLGWLVTAVAMAVAIAAITGSTSRLTPARLAARYGWSLGALVLVAVGSIRAADWLFALCLVGAVLCLPMALSTGTSTRALFLGLTSIPLSVLRAVPWSWRGLAPAARHRSLARTVIAVLVTVVLVLVFGTLLATADPVFSRTVELLLPTLDALSIPRWLLSFLVVTLCVLSLAYLASAPPSFDSADARRPATLRRIEWALPIGALMLLFAAFVATQATVLYGGDEYVRRTAGVSFAEHARSGFWQLLVVTLLTLLVIAVVARRAPRESTPDRIWLRVMLGALTVLSLAIVASALNRMWAYESAYGFTRLRLLVSVAEIWLGLVFLLVLAAGVRLTGRAAWLPRAVVATAIVALVGVVALNPDRFIAEQNVARFQESHRIDVWYLRGLSVDAVPALMALEEPYRSCALGAMSRELETLDPDAWQHWSLARSEARATLPGPVSFYCGLPRS